MKAWLHALLFASGGAGLMYEVCWSRALALWLGHGERGAAATLTLFFLGMAAGYALAAKQSQRSINVLFAYAGCELSICASALLIAGASQIEALESYLWLSLLVPTTAMGASLPLIMQALTERGFAEVTGYAWHLLGATLGTLLSTFVLIEHVGVFHTTWLAAAMSALCAAGALFLSRGAEKTALPPAARVEPRLLFAAAVAGFSTLSLEVLCLRLFALTFHNSTYTFGLTIAVFVLCLALGSRRVGSLAHEKARTYLSTAAALTSLFVLLTVPLFGIVTRFGELRAPTFGAYILLSLGLLVLILLLPVTGAGTLLPALFRAAAVTNGDSVGRLSAANSLGAALGAFVATFVLLPRVGLFAAFVGVALCYALLSVLLGTSMLRRAALAVGIAVAAVATFPAQPLPNDGLRLLERWQGPFGWVDLVQDPKDQSLSARLDLHYQLGNSRDRARHMSMGTLPLSLHPKPQRAMFVGLATGMTTSASLDFKSLEHVEVVELIAEVKQLARRFSAYNRQVLDDPRVKVLIEDGRSHMRDGSSHFDVIISDLFVPWHSQAGYLYSVEHYRHVRKRLSKDGLFAQWLPVYMLDQQELEWIGRSLVDAFPCTTAWLVNQDPKRTLLALIGHMRPPETLKSSPDALFLGHFSAMPGSELNSDERPRVEFQAPRSERSSKLLVGARLSDYLARRFKQ